MPGYGQFCPIAKTMEILDERWTVLIIRELLMGSNHFNELRRGVPKMSPALLSKRLRSLSKAGIVLRRDDGNRVTYELTPGGRALEPIVMALGEWGTRWRTELGEEDYDPSLLMWDVRRNVDVDAVPSGRVVVAFEFPDVPSRTRRWWLVVSPDRTVDLCDADPGFPVDVKLTASLPTLVHVWRGEVSWARALREGTVRLEGTSGLRRAFPGWLRMSPFASAHGEPAGVR